MVKYDYLTTSRRRLSCSCNLCLSRSDIRSEPELTEPGDELPSPGDDLNSSTRGAGVGFSLSATACLKIMLQ